MARSTWRARWAIRLPVVKAGAAPRDPLVTAPRGQHVKHSILGLRSPRQTRWLGYRVACPRSDQHQLLAHRLRQVSPVGPRCLHHVLDATWLAVDPSCWRGSNNHHGTGSVSDPGAADLFAPASMHGPDIHDRHAYRLHGCNRADRHFARSVYNPRGVRRHCVSVVDDSPDWINRDLRRPAAVTPSLDGAQLPRDTFSNYFSGTDRGSGGDGTCAADGNDPNIALVKLAASTADL
jgi:hypothetical protein